MAWHPGPKDYLELGTRNGYCSHCGFKFKAHELRQDFYSSLRTCEACYDSPHPLDRPTIQRPEQNIPIPGLVTRDGSENQTAMPAVNLFIQPNAQILEGDVGTTILQFTVVADCDGHVDPWSVDFETLDNTATTADLDYVGQTGTIEGRIGVSRYYINVVVNGDLTLEADEVVLVRLLNPVGAAIDPASASGVAGLILNDDVNLAVPIQFPAGGDGDVDMQEATQTITADLETLGVLITPAVLTVDVVLGTPGGLGSGGPATPGLDVILGTYVVTISSIGLTQHQLAIPNVIIDDDLYEPAQETVGLVITGATGGAGLGTELVAGGSIESDDPPPIVNLEVDNMTKEEGESFVFRAFLDVPSGIAGSATFSVTPGSGVPGVDYIDVSQTVTFAPGETEKFFTVTTLETDTNFDTLSSPALTGVITPSNFLITSGGVTQVPVNITNDDVVPPLVVNIPSAFSINEDGVPQALVLTASEAPNAVDGPLVVTVDIVDVTTSGAIDRNLGSSALVTFPVGSTNSDPLLLSAVDDMLTEGAETFTITINPTGFSATYPQAVVGPSATCIVTINDTSLDPPPADVIITDESVAGFDSLPPYTQFARAIFAPAGTLTFQAGPSSGPNPPTQNWLISGVAADYEIRATQLSATGAGSIIRSGPLNVWVSMNFNLTWSLSETTQGMATWGLLFEIRAVANPGTILTSANIALSTEGTL